MSAESANVFGKIDEFDLVKIGHRTLIVGDVDRWRAAGRDTVGGKNIRYIDPADLTADLLIEFDPHIILSPLFFDAFDVFDVAENLQQNGFKGQYRVLCTDGPDTDVIRIDIAQIAPDLDFDLLQVPSVKRSAGSDDT